MLCVTERNERAECLQCSLMSSLCACRHAKLHRSAPQSPEKKTRKNANCEIPLDRENEDRQEKRRNFWNDGS